MIRSVLLSVLLATVLAGQSSVFTTNPAGQPGRPRTLKEFLQRTADPDPLFLLEDGSPGADAFLDLAKEDPLLEWGLTPRRFGPEDPLQKELREREGWPKGPRWALLDGRGRVRATGTLPTTARELEERLREGGYRPRYELLQEFLRRQPGRGDAWSDLLLAQRSRAFRLLRPLRKSASAGASLTNPLPGAPELVHPLSEAEDERLFAPVAAALHGLLEVEGWGESLSSWMFFPDNPELHSPRLRDEARIQLPKVEAFLRGRPSHVYGWMLWAFLFPLTDRDPPTFLQDLVAVPGTRSEIPPAVALPELMRQFRRLERWSSVKAIATPRWDRFRQETVIVEMKGRVQAFQWEGIFIPLLEAHLKLGERSRADELVGQAVEWSPSKDIWRLFVKLARDCHDEGLAAQWERLAPAPVKAP